MNEVVYGLVAACAGVFSTVLTSRATVCGVPFSNLRGSGCMVVIARARPFEGTTIPKV